MFGITGVERDEAVLCLNDAHRGETVTAENPYPFGRILDRWPELIEVANAIEQLLVGDGAVWRLH